MFIEHTKGNIATDKMLWYASPFTGKLIQINR